MTEFRVRVYDDHYLVTDETVGVGTKVVEKGDLEAALSDAGVNKTRPVVRKSRTRRTKEQIAAAKAAKEAKVQA